MAMIQPNKMVFVFFSIENTAVSIKKREIVRISSGTGSTGTMRPSNIPKRSNSVNLVGINASSFILENPCGLYKSLVPETIVQR